MTTAAGAPVVVVVGAGPGIGMAVARRFGGEGFRVALVSRDAGRLQERVGELDALGIRADAYPADVADGAQVVDAFAAIRERSGDVEVLEWGPWTGGFDDVAAVDMDVDHALAYLGLKCLGTVTGVRQVLPGMLARGRGTVLVTTGGAAVRPVPRLAPYAMAAAAERMYALSLNAELAGSGVHVGVVTISARVGAGPVDADDVAEAHWRLHTARDRAEIELPPR